MMNEQVMVYEIKSSANKNANELFHDNGRFFYWNQNKFSNLLLGDIVFVINRHSNYVLFTKVESRDISIKFDDKLEESKFTDKEQTFNVSGKWNDFVCLEIINKIKTTVEWKWKSLGSSETTYLNGTRINTKASKNRLLNIYQLSETTEKTAVRKVLNSCRMNFSKNNLYAEIIEVIKSEEVHYLCKEKEFWIQKGTNKLI